MTLHAPVEHHWRQFERGLQAAATILDLGCGAGRDLRHFQAIGLKPVGVDSSLPLLLQARKLTSAPVVVGDLRALPFAPSSFEGVWALASLHHLKRDEVLAVLKELRNVLRPHGRFLATVKMGIGQEVDRYGRFFAYYRDEEWRYLLGRAGFQVLSITVDHERRSASNGGAHEVEWLCSVAARS